VEVTVPFNHITLGNVLEICTMMIMGAGFIFGLRSALATLALRMDSVEREIGKLTNILITLGKYEERFLRNEGDIWELKHGRGFVTETPTPARGQFVGYPGPRRGQPVAPKPQEDQS
jgi:hypothetical protein